MARKQMARLPYTGDERSTSAGAAVPKDETETDSGFTDWTQQLLSNRKERLLISGMGS